MKSNDQTLLEEAYGKIKVSESNHSAALWDLLARYEDLKYDLADKKISKEKYTTLSLQLLDQLVDCIEDKELEDQSHRAANFETTYKG